MRKLLIMLLALCLICTAALAETPDAPIEVNWADVEAEVQEAGWGGGFYELDGLGLKIYIPALLQPVEMDGLFAAFATEDMESGVMVIVEENGIGDLNDVAELMSAGGATGVEFDLVNGLPGISYQIENIGYMSFVTDGGYMISFAASPMDDEGFAAVATVILSSVQAIE